MSKHIIYQGEFVSQSNVVWSAEIWKEIDDAPNKVGILSFDVGESVVIEWGVVS